MNHRVWINLGLIIGSIFATCQAAPLVLGSRRELFVDRYLIDTMRGVELRLNHPQSGGVALKLDQPWEGIVSAYVTVIKDGNQYIMYYRGRPTRSGADGAAESHEVACVALSSDGIQWTRPKLGLCSVDGSTENNVILTKPINVTHNFAPFLDSRPGVPRDERFKGVGGTGSAGLFGFVSPDGFRWKLAREKALITEGAFDSQNIIFWSELEQEYLCYFRTFKNGVRWITRSTSKDFLEWTAPVDMSFGDAPNEHLYINQTQPYFRAPHIYIALPARFNPRRAALTAEQMKEIDIDSPLNYAELKHDDSDAVFMSSRGGNVYDRTFLESFIRPGNDLRNWVARANYPALGVVPTGPSEMSIYIIRHYGQPSIFIERMTLRTDGFASVHAPYTPGEMITKPLTFTGDALSLNFSSSAVGGLRIQLEDLDGKPLPKYGFGDSVEMIGDGLDEIARWKHGSALDEIAGRPVRLHFQMKDADLYSFQFR